MAQPVRAGAGRSQAAVAAAASRRHLPAAACDGAHSLSGQAAQAAGRRAHGGRAPSAHGAAAHQGGSCLCFQLERTPPEGGKGCSLPPAGFDMSRHASPTMLLSLHMLPCRRRTGGSCMTLPQADSLSAGALSSWCHFRQPVADSLLLTAGWGSCDAVLPPCCPAGCLDTCSMLLPLDSVRRAVALPLCLKFGLLLHAPTSCPLPTALLILLPVCLLPRAPICPLRSCCRPAGAPAGVFPHTPWWVGVACCSRFAPAAAAGWQLSRCTLVRKMLRSSSNLLWAAGLAP